MKIKHTLFGLLIVTALALTACGQAATPEAMPAKDTTASEAMAEQPTTEAMMAEKPAADAMMDEKPAADAMMDEKPTTDAMMDEKPAADAMMDKPAVELPAWFSASLTDVNSGQPFTVADHQGKVVLVETLAVWCSNCMKQQKQVLALHEALGERDDFVSVGLDIDLNESAEPAQGPRRTQRLQLGLRRGHARGGPCHQRSVRRQLPQPALDADADHRPRRPSPPPALRHQERRRPASRAGTVLERGDVGG